MIILEFWSAFFAAMSGVNGLAVERDSNVVDMGKFRAARARRARA